MKDVLTALIGAVVGGVIGFIASRLQWRLNLKEERKKLKREKLEVLVGKIHDANREVADYIEATNQNIVPDNRASMDIIFSNIYLIVTLYLLEFAALEHRLGKAYLLMIGESHSKDAFKQSWEERCSQLLGELRGFEQDVVNLFQGDIKFEDLSFPEIK